MNAPKAIRKIDSEKAMQWVQEKLSIKLTEKQIDAVWRASEDDELVHAYAVSTHKSQG